jgi:lactoylglutathione lyase
METTARERDLHILATHHIALATAHFDLLREFYTETLGLSVLGGFPEQRILFLDAGTTAIELAEEAGAERPVGARGWAHLALEVADVDAAYATLSARGVPFHIPPEDFPRDVPAVRIAFCTDPDGNVIELLQPLGSRYPTAVSKASHRSAARARASGTSSASR